MPVLPDGGAGLTDEEKRHELETNAQSILGYVVRWVGLGIGCSTVPDLEGVGLMEDRATLRISSQEIANWLHHGLVDEAQVRETFARMAVLVDEQNAREPGYQPMSKDLENSPSFQAALELVFAGRQEPNGYTERALTHWRQKAKAGAGNGDGTRTVVPDDDAPSPRRADACAGVAPRHLRPPRRGAPRRCRSAGVRRALRRPATPPRSTRPSSRRRSGYFVVGYVAGEPVARGGAGGGSGGRAEPSASAPPRGVPGTWTPRSSGCSCVTAHRGRGHARAVLAELERTAAAAGRRRAVLETGTRQPEAIALYTSAGYGPDGPVRVLPRLAELPVLRASC